ncbi:histidine phosphatase family protein [Corticibacter populi]|uniref:Histidine phosphatase family protein n=1 Tax=Corticibacter populi TaxID=1550736 RepID=A0A3M6QPK9_9BURK|nr:histidine phosphatase family protein [Corticibacter populi]RMX04968.1 histidine phosphatase family protein [Corticibacter populi]RZS33605.1 phosphoglycerate mutase [Corticibacter populi]
MAIFSTTPAIPAAGDDPLSVTRLTVIRHGETAWNHAGRVQGHTDIGLNETGRWQAERMARALVGADIDTLYSSDLARTWQTAKPLQAVLAVHLHGEPGLRERCYGALEGLTAAQMREQDPRMATAMRDRDSTYAPRGGESMAAFRVRVLEALQRIAAACRGQHIGLVTHGGVLDILYRHAAGLDLQVARGWPIENTSINRFLWAPHGLTLLSWGDNAHLEGAATLDERVG